MCPDLINIDNAYNSLGLRDFDSIVFKYGTTYYTRKYDGTLISSSTTPETVLQAAFNLKGTIYIAAADYNIVSTGLTMSSDTRLFFAKGARILAPNNTVITLLTCTDVGWNCVIDGLYTDEQGGNNKKYNALKLSSAASTGIAFMTIDNCYFYKPDTGLELETTTANGYINSCRFNDITIHGAKSASVLWDRFSGGTIQNNGFFNVGIEMDSDTLFGFKDISDQNTFVNCNVWDSVSTAVEVQIASGARDILIIGGQMAGRSGKVVDNGIRTCFIAPNQTNASGPFGLFRPDQGKQGSFWGNNNVGDGILSGRVTVLTVGSGANNPVQDSTGTYRTFSTGATINSLTGHYGGSTTLTSRVNGAYWKCQLQLNNNTNMRVFAGLINSATAPASSADQLNAIAGIGLWLDTGVSANWKRAHNDSAGAGVYDDTSTAANTGQKYTIEIYADSQDSQFSWLLDGVRTNITSDIPSSTANLGYYMYVENTTAADRVIRCYYYTIGGNK